MPFVLSLVSSSEKGTGAAKRCRRRLHRSCSTGSLLAEPSVVRGSSFRFAMRTVGAASPLPFIASCGRSSTSIWSVSSMPLPVTSFASAAPSWSLSLSSSMGEERSTCSAVPFRAGTRGVLGRASVNIRIRKAIDGKVLRRTLTKHLSLRRLWAAYAICPCPYLHRCRLCPIRRYRRRGLSHRLRSQWACLENGGISSDVRTVT